MTAYKLDYGLNSTEADLGRRAWLSTREPLTGLWNERFLREFVARRGRPGSVAVLRCVPLDAISTALAAQSLAVALAETVPSESAVAALGGSLLAVFVENRNSDHMARYAEHLWRRGIDIEDWNGPNTIRIISVVAEIDSPEHFSIVLGDCCREIDCAADAGHPILIRSLGA